MQYQKRLAEVNVKDFGAVGNGIVDDTIAIQRVLNMGKRTILIPQGTYKISVALKISSHTTIKADSKAIIRLADYAGINRDVFLLTNADFQKSNKDIIIEGGVWDGNSEFNPRGADGDVNGYTGAAINFINVKNLTLKNLTVRNPEAYSIRLCRIDNFVIEDIRFDNPVVRPNQDGIHLNGFCQNGIIRKLRALSRYTPNDDMVALNADDDTDRVINLGMECGPIRNIIVDDIHAEEAYTFIRILSCNEIIEDITISNVSGGCRINAVNMDSWKFPRGTGNIRNVKLMNFYVHKVPDNPPSDWAAMAPLVTIQTFVHKLNIENFHRANDDNFPASTLYLNNKLQNHLQLDGAEREYNEFLLPKGGFSSLHLNSIR